MFRPHLDPKTLQSETKSKEPVLITKSKDIPQKETKLPGCRFFSMLAEDLQLKSLNGYLSLKELLVTVSLVSKEARALVQETEVYKFLMKGQKLLADAKDLNEAARNSFRNKPINGAIALGEELITIKQAHQLSLSTAPYYNDSDSDEDEVTSPILDYLLNDHGLIALREKLVTVNQFEELKEPENIKLLLRNHGLIALREKLITVEQADQIHYDILSLMMSENGLVTLREKLIIINEVSNFNQGYKLQKLLGDYGLIALREKLITVEQAHQIQSNILELVLTNTGIAALREKLIQIDQIVSLSGDRGNPDYERLKELLTKNGLILLRCKLLTFDSAFAFDKAFHLKNEILKLIVKIALEEKLITNEQIEAFKARCPRYPILWIESLFNHNGLTALREKLITADQAMQFQGPCILELLTTDIGMIALRNGFILLEQVKMLTAWSTDDDYKILDILLSSAGIEALRQGLITYEDARKFKSSAILELVLEKNGIVALSEKLISLDQIQPLIGYPRMDHPNYSWGKLFWLLTNNGLAALREGLMTFDSLYAFEGGVDDLRNVLSDEGLKVAREATKAQLKKVTAQESMELETVNRFV